MPLAELKREHTRRRAAADRLVDLEARFQCVARLLAHYPAFVPSFLLAAAIAPPADCPLCVSPYTDCWVHTA